MICSDLTNVLTRAVAQKTPLKLSAEISGEQRTYLARPVKLVGEGGEDGIWVQLPDEKHRVLEELSQLRPMCSASCCVDHARYCFETAVLERDRHFWLNDQIMLDALLLQSPVDFRHVQERSCERLLVSDGSGVSAQLFRLGSSANPGGTKRPELLAVPGKLRDLSPRGAGFICPFERNLSLARKGEMMACVVHFRGLKIPLTATLAQTTPISNRTLRVGICFQLPSAETPVAPEQAEKADSLKKVIDELERQRSLRQVRPKR